MAYRVIPVKRLKGPQFKVLFDRFENGKRVYKSVPKDEWHRHGLTLSMSIEEAKAQAVTLNQLEKVSRLESKRQACLARSAKTRLEQQTALPESYRAEFERHKLPDTQKGKSYWNTAAKVVTAVGLPPEQWVDYTESFYREFLKRKMSPAYINNILPLINRWGAFYSRKLGKPFDKIPAPPRSWAATIAEAHFNKTKGRGCRESEPLTPAMLTRGEFTEAERRWLSFTVWFGLRPVEVDLLASPPGKRTWRVEGGFLHIYQTKLKGVKPEKRTKSIPAFRPEQKALLVDMRLPVSRPKRNSMKKAFGEAVTLYGGRKGFEALMQSFKQPFEKVSAWLGHSDVNRTYRNYFNRQDVKPAA